MSRLIVLFVLAGCGATVESVAATSTGEPTPDASADAFGSGGAGGAAPLCLPQPCPVEWVAFCPHLTKTYCCTSASAITPVCSVDAGLLATECPIGCAAPCAVAGDGGTTACGVSLDGGAS